MAQVNKNRSLVRSVAAALCAAGLAVAGGVAKQPASAQPFLDTLGRPTPETVARVNAFADQPYVPAEVSNTLRTAVQFFAGAGEELHGGAEGVADFRRHVRLVRESVDARDGLGRRAAKGVEERLRAGWLLSDASGHRQTGRAERRGHGTDEGPVLVHLRHSSHMRTNFKRSWQIAAPIARAKSALVTGWRVVRSVRSGGIV